MKTRFDKLQTLSLQNTSNRLFSSVLVYIFTLICLSTSSLHFFISFNFIICTTLYSSISSHHRFYPSQPRNRCFSISTPTPTSISDSASTSTASLGTHSRFPDSQLTASFPLHAMANHYLIPVFPSSFCLDLLELFLKVILHFINTTLF